MTSHTRLKTLKAGAVMAVCLGAGCGGGGAAAPPVAPPLPALTVSGTRIVEAESGATVVLRGFVFTAGVWFDVPPGAADGDLANLGFMESEADFAQIADWGANLAILYLNYRWFEHGPTDVGWAFVDQVLDWCRNHHVYLLPSLVVYPGGGQRGGTAFFQSANFQAQAQAFWLAFVDRYHDRPEIAGYDLLNEPQGAATADILAYQTGLIDAIRAVHPDTVLFIEPMWGDPYSLQPINRPGLVYDAHYYLPLFFTSQRFPWLYGGAIPAGVHYPDLDGSMVENVVVNAEADDPAVPAGSYDWQTLTTSYPIPAGTELAYVKVFSDADSGAAVYFDDIQAATDGTTFAPIPNGSFETKSDVFDDAAYWNATVANGGTVARTNEAAADGQWSVKIAGSGGLSQYATHPGTDANMQSIYFLGTASGIPVAGAATLNLRWKVKATNASAAKNGVHVSFCTVTRQNYGHAELQAELDRTVGAKVQAFNAPLIIGEFAASLVGTRPDILDWTSDVMSYANAQGISWAYYHYREVKDQLRYLGLFEGPFGTATDYGTVDADTRDRIKAALAQ